MEGRRGIIYRLTRLLYPLCDLAEAGRRALAQGAQILRLAPHSRLPSVAEQSWLTYVLRGEFMVTGPEGYRERVPAGSERARHPLFEPMPRRLEAVTPEGAIVLRFDRTQLCMWNGSRQSSGFPVELAARVLQACRAGLPALPPAAAALHGLEPALAVEAPLRELAHAIAREPELERRFLAAVNRGRAIPVRSAGEAVLCLGPHAARTLAITLAARPLFTTALPAQRRRMEEMFVHSLFTGCLAYVIARQTPAVVPERALLGGLVHDAGAIPIIAYAETHPEAGVGDAELGALIPRLRTLTGPVLVERLRLPREYAAAAEQADRWLRDGPQLELTDLIVVAHLLVGTSSGAKQPPLADTPAFQKLRWPQFTQQRATRLIGAAHSMATALRRRLL